MSDQDRSDLARLVRAGDLEAARAAAAARVRAAPSDAAARLDLADILIVLGELDRADNHLDLAATHDPSRAVAIALVRQLVRAAIWRRETFDERRPPELVTEPDAAIQVALVLLAGGKVAAEEPPVLSGTRNGDAFIGWRDLDDRTAGILEVLTSTGKYVWVPLAAIAALSPRAPERLRDTIWRPAEMEVAGGPSGVVYLPVIYHGTSSAMTDELRLGRATDWVEDAAGTRGVGQRCWLVGDDVVTIDDIGDLAVAR